MGTPGATDRQAVIDRIVAGSAKVMVEWGGRRITSGSGVVVASKAAGSGIEAVSYVLTAAHILESKDGAVVFVRFTGAYAIRGKFAATVPRRGSPETLDLALLRVSGVAVPPVSLPTEDRVHVGEEILVVGFPWGKRLGLFSGIVSQVPGDGREDVPADEGTEQSIVVDASSSRGVSGGGVFREATGSLVGVVEGYQTASIAVKDRAQTYSVRVPMPGETFVVPIARIRGFLEEAGLGEASGMTGKIENPGD
ncbi:MAG: trypsin-like peptidase domain-containing protein [candidate division NC10 bacterium]|nr:trypsin-like peptidase domain-containing protein [candidate division NC10 bacterium]